MGRLGTGFVNFLSILPLALGTITGGGFFVGGGDIVRDLTSQSLLEFVLPFGDTVPRYLASPLLFLCTVAGLRNSDELFATSTDMVSLFFLIYRHISQHAWINDETFDSNFLTISRLCIVRSSTSVRPYRTLKHILIEDMAHAQNLPLCVFQGQLVLDIGYRRNCITGIGHDKKFKEQISLPWVAEVWSEFWSIRWSCPGTRDDDGRR